MKLSIAQALGTVLNLQIAPVQQSAYFVIRDPSGDALLDRIIGRVEDMTFDQAVWKACEMVDFSKDSNFAIFPMGSNREEIYMAAERELLRQEVSIEFSGQKMWELLPKNDPREVIMYLMEQIRECAVSVVNPSSFQANVLRVLVLNVAIMQWTQNWIGVLRVRNASLQANQPERPKIVEIGRHSPEEASASQAPVPPLFGADGLRVVPERKGFDDDLKTGQHPQGDAIDEILEANDICSKHDERRPCRECAEDERIAKGEAAQEENN